MSASSKNRFRPAVDALEDRMLLTTGMSGSLLHVHGPHTPPVVHHQPHHGHTPIIIIVLPGHGHGHDHGHGHGHRPGHGRIVPF